MECRITSEDPAHGFLPSTGTVTHIRLPAGPGVRWDGGIDAGSEISLFYDPLVGKLIVRAPTRRAAIARMRRALLELTIAGVQTSRDFHLRVLEDEEFRRGEIDIQWLERRLSSLVERDPPPETLRAVAIVAALLADRDRVAPPRPTHSNGMADDAWTRLGRLEALR